MFNNYDYEYIINQKILHPHAFTNVLLHSRLSPLAPEPGARIELFLLSFAIPYLFEGMFCIEGTASNGILSSR